MSQQVDVMVGGRNYRLAVPDGQEARVKGLALHVDGLLGELKGADPLMDRDRMLVLAAMQMASEITEYQDKLDDQNNSVMRFHRELAQRLETLLPN